MRNTLLVLLLSVSASSASSADISVDSVKKDIIRACTDERFNPNIMLAICERESAFGKTLDKNWKGDGGHGFGVMQIDNRSHGDWIATHDWRDTYVSCTYAIGIMRSNLKQLGWHVQKAIAAYNCGVGNVRRASHWDSRTTGRNYCADVLRRARKFN